MERNKMEEEFKEKLNQREIAPTPHAWDRLDAMLNDAEEKKAAPVRSINWLYIAAGFAGVILVATMFFKRGEATHQNEVVIEQVKDDNPATNPVDSVNGAEKSEIQIDNSQVAEVGAQNQRQNNTAQKQVLENEGNIQPTSDKMQDRQTQIAEAAVKNPSEDKIINPMQNSERVSNEQIASLEPHLKQPKAIKIDANSLLSEVDGELELSFREKVIKLANKKYQNVKVALANRNIEN